MGWNYLSIPKLQRLHRWSLGMDKLFHPTLYNECNYLSMLGLKLNQVSKTGPRKAWQETGCVVAHNPISDKSGCSHYNISSHIWIYIYIKTWYSIPIRSNNHKWKYFSTSCACDTKSTSEHIVLLTIDLKTTFANWSKKNMFKNGLWFMIHRHLFLRIQRKIS